MTRSSGSGYRPAKRINYRGTWQLVQPDQIAAFRERHDLSPAAFGRLVGVTYQAVNNWERGGAVASIANQARIASLLGLAPAPVPPEARRLAETGQIVQGMLQARTGPLELPELVHLIRAVRAAVEEEPSPV